MKRTACDNDRGSSRSRGSRIGLVAALLNFGGGAMRLLDDLLKN